MLIWPSRPVLDILGWVWPPALLGLVVWMIIEAHRRLRSRTRRWLMYPLLAALTLAALGGGYETIQESIDASAHPMGGELIDARYSGEQLWGGLCRDYAAKVSPLMIGSRGRRSGRSAKT
jgi:hypothetical protein